MLACPDDLVLHCGVHSSYMLWTQCCCRTHQHSRSQYASKVPDLLCDVVTLHRGATREEEQDVAEHTYDAQRYQGDPQTLGKAAWTHSNTDASTHWLENN